MVHRDGGSEIALTTEDNGNRYSPDWSPAGDWVAYSRYDQTRHYQIYRTDIPVAVGEAQAAARCPEQTVRVTRILGRRLSLTLTVAGPGVVTMAVCDPAGRTIHRSSASAPAAGPFQVDWDGTDARARPVSPGLYFIELRSGHSASRCRVLKLSCR
jgi:hypothetical protein